MYFGVTNNYDNQYCMIYSIFKHYPVYPVLSGIILYFSTPFQNQHPPTKKAHNQIPNRECNNNLFIFNHKSVEDMSVNFKTASFNNRATCSHFFLQVIMPFIHFFSKLAPSSSLIKRCLLQGSSLSLLMDV